MWTVNFTSGTISVISHTATLTMILVRDALPVVEEMLFSDGFERQ